jgi:hypothetical protein
MNHPFFFFDELAPDTANISHRPGRVGAVQAPELPQVRVEKEQFHPSLAALAEPNSCKHITSRGNGATSSLDVIMACVSKNVK